VPVPLSTLEKLDSPSLVSVDVDHVVQRKRATKALWVSMRNGVPISSLCDSYEDAVAATPMGIDHFNVAKLHPVGDLELINKIRAKFN